MAKMNGGDGVNPMVPLRPFPPGGISRPFLLPKRRQRTVPVSFQAIRREMIRGMAAMVSPAIMEMLLVSA